MISKRIQEVEPSSTVELTTRITVMKREGIPVIGLNVGEPDFDTPAHICQAGHGRRIYKVYAGHGHAGVKRGHS